MSEPMTEREAALAARIEALETQLANRTTAAGVGPVDQVWSYLRYLIPPPLLGAGIVAFVGFHLWAYYNDSLKQAAEVRLKEAKAAVKEADASAKPLLDLLISEYRHARDCGLPWSARSATLHTHVYRSSVQSHWPGVVQ